MNALNIFKEGRHIYEEKHISTSLDLPRIVSSVFMGHLQVIDLKSVQMRVPLLDHSIAYNFNSWTCKDHNIDMMC